MLYELEINVSSGELRNGASFDSKLLELDVVLAAIHAATTYLSRPLYTALSPAVLWTLESLFRGVLEAS